MFNPFYPFTSALLQAFIDKGKIFFVRQQFTRGRNKTDEDVKGYFLITAYDNFTTAQDHYGAIAYDPYRFLYDWNKGEDQDRLKLAASEMKEYRVFTAVFKLAWEREISDALREKIRRYIQTLGWSPAGKDVVDTSYEVRFGELYLCLKYKKREARVKFEEIELLS